MNPGRNEELLARFIAGETLSPAEKRDLLQVMKDDRSFRTLALSDQELDGMLRVLGAGRPKTDGGGFLQGVRRRLARESPLGTQDDQRLPLDSQSTKSN